MIKFLAELQNGGTLYGFGLAEANLNRLEFNNEPIFFDFEYAKHPELFGLILYFNEFEEPAEIAENIEAVQERSIPFIDEEHGVNGDTLRVFPIAKRIMREMRTPLWSFQTKATITNPNDMQMFFSGRTEHELEQYFLEKGLISPKTKRTYKGFGK
ncbi:MAG: hypothetical protein HWQ38_24325 [Nostoc sp. NMS7]|uniref:hypothetical protein n=1 Tax=Nostoc sp. NMS7 TaxID=2815391 RepID=UPI0025F7A6B5|nr:hypothetical protein [Nostoc sp. NMS7]MBN3949421.1 hypothetical protein [Nostoc sp. NMS7]